MMWNILLTNLYFCHEDDLVNVHLIHIPNTHARINLHLEGGFAYVLPINHHRKPCFGVHSFHLPKTSFEKFFFLIIHVYSKKGHRNYPITVHSSWLGQAYWNKSPALIGRPVWVNSARIGPRATLRWTCSPSLITVSSTKL